MSAPVTQSERAKPTANTMLPTASDNPPARNRRIQVSAAGEKIWPILELSDRDASGVPTALRAGEFHHSAVVKSGSRREPRTQAAVDGRGMSASRRDGR